LKTWHLDPEECATTKFVNKDWGYYNVIAHFVSHSLISRLKNVEKWFSFSFSLSFSFCGLFWHGKHQMRTWNGDSL